MAKRKRERSRQRRWTKAEVGRLKALSRRKMPAARVARALNRSLNSTKRKASTLVARHARALDRAGSASPEGTRAREAIDSLHCEKAEANGVSDRKSSIEFWHFA